MKKLLYILLFSALPTLVVAQVEKSVEVTKDFMPSVAGASKMAILPDMADTAALRPDIDYSITPLAMATTVSTTPIRPATVTYWEFNRSKPFYMKLGAGWPLNSVADIYATTQNPGTGYLSAYFNHEGRFRQTGDLILRDAFYDQTANAARMFNRGGIAAGKYLGNHTLEGEISYDNRRYHRLDGVALGQEFDPKVGYGEFGMLVRLGDDFKDLSRLNFDVALRGTLFDGRSDLVEGSLRARQTNLGVDAALARQFRRHTIRAHAKYIHESGAKDISNYTQDIFMAGVRYGYGSGKFGLEAGADYYYDKIVGRDASHYVLPFLRLQVNVGRGFVPYVEIDGSLRDNSLRTLSQVNPYLNMGTWIYENPFGDFFPSHNWSGKSSVDYNLRVGIRGGTASNKFAYRLYGGASICENHVFWLAKKVMYFPYILDFTPEQGRLNTVSVNGELEYRPVSRLLFNVEAHGYFYGGDETFERGLPGFRAAAGVRYTAKKVSFGVRAAMQSERTWSVLTNSILDYLTQGEVYSVPFTVDLSADVDWRITRGFGLFAEVRNITDSKIYDWPYYREYGINFTAGVKLIF